MPRPGPDHPVVCDPLPAPVDCSNAGFLELPSALSATAAWTPDARKVSFYVRGTYRSRGMSYELLRVTGARLDTPTTAPAAYSAWLVPEPGAKTITGVLALHCAGDGTRTVMIRIELGAPLPGGSLPVEVLRDCSAPWTARDAAQVFAISSRWVSDKTAEIVVRPSAVGDYGFKGEAHAKGAKVVDTQTKDRAWAVLLEPIAGATEVVVTVPVTCGGIAQPLDVQLTLTGARGTDQPIAVQPRSGR
jgi:hypothetical protein